MIWLRTCLNQWKIDVKQTDGKQNVHKNMNEIIMTGIVFSFNYANKLTIKCAIVNEPKGSSYIKSPDWLKCENATMNTKILMTDVFSMLIH